MERIEHIWRAKPGCADAYARRPDLEQLLRAGGVRSYTIYSWGDVIFSHLEVEDFEQLVERFDGDPVAQRWGAEFSDILQYPNAEPETGWPERLREIWSLEGRGS